MAYLTMFDLTILLIYVTVLFYTVEYYVFKNSWELEDRLYRFNHKWLVSCRDSDELDKMWLISRQLRRAYFG